MTKIILRISIGFLGISAICIATSIILFGFHATGAFFEGVYIALTGHQAGLTPVYSVNADSELRFYSALWLAYGVLAVIAAYKFEQKKHWIPWLSLVFFGGGLARLMSYFTVGAPHPFFIVLLCIELVLPIILLGLWALERNSD